MNPFANGTSLNVPLSGKYNRINDPTNSRGDIHTTEPMRASVAPQVIRPPAQKHADTKPVAPKAQAVDPYAFFKGGGVNV